MREGDHFGSYRLERRIAVGGMAEVFLAQRIGVAGFARQVCIKRMREDLCAAREFVDMFIDEARVGSQLRHGNIVAIDDFGEVDGQYFLCMELVSGADLSQLLAQLAKDGRAMPIEVAVFIAGEMLKGLDYAHRKLGQDSKPLGIVHRDISPHNVLVSSAGEVKITDFGIAKASARLHQTVGPVMKGKMAYMAPEQARGSTVDARADLFATGVVLFEVLAGRRPFTGANESELLIALTAGKRESIADIRPDAPPALVALVDRLMATTVADRFASAADAIAELTPLQRGISAQRTLAAMLGHYFPGASSSVRNAGVFSAGNLPPAPTSPNAGGPTVGPAVPPSSDEPDAYARTDASRILEAKLASDPGLAPLPGVVTEVARSPFEPPEHAGATVAARLPLDASGHTEVSRSPLDQTRSGRARDIAETREHTSIEPLGIGDPRETSPTERTRTSLSPRVGTEPIAAVPSASVAAIASGRPGGAQRSLARTMVIAVCTASAAAAIVYAFLAR